MELRHLKTFTVVADALGFTKAAEILGYSQSSVTMQIQSLEEELDTTLFDRLGKTIVVTDAGKKLLPFAREMMRLQSAMKEVLHADQPPSGTLTIGAPESIAAYRLPPIIQIYRQLYPAVTIVLKPNSSTDLLGQVRNGQIDLAFLLDQAISAPDLSVEILVEETMVLVAPVDHALVCRELLGPSDLKNETFLHSEPGCSYRELFNKYLRENGIAPSLSMEFWNLETIKKCVASGLGISLLPLIAVQSDIEDGRLATLPWDTQPVKVATQLVYHDAKWVSPTMQAFLDIVNEFVQHWNHS